MTHKTIRVNDVHNFYWFDSKPEAMRKVKELHRIGITPVWGGKRAKSWANYLDIKSAAIYQNKWSGSGMTWVVAY